MLDVKLRHGRNAVFPVAIWAIGIDSHILTEGLVYAAVKAMSKGDYWYRSLAHLRTRFVRSGGIYGGLRVALAKANGWHYVRYSTGEALSADARFPRHLDDLRGTGAEGFLEVGERIDLGDVEVFRPNNAAPQISRQRTRGNVYRCRFYRSTVSQGEADFGDYVETAAQAWAALCGAPDSIQQTLLSELAPEQIRPGWEYEHGLVRGNGWTLPMVTMDALLWSFALHALAWGHHPGSPLRASLQPVQDSPTHWA